MLRESHTLADFQLPCSARIDLCVILRPEVLPLLGLSVKKPFKRSWSPRGSQCTTDSWVAVICILRAWQHLSGCQWIKDRDLWFSMAPCSSFRQCSCLWPTDGTMSYLFLCYETHLLLWNILVVCQPGLWAFISSLLVGEFSENLWIQRARHLG